MVGGRFCSHCGASLDPAEGSLGGEIRAKFMRPATAALAFLKAVWLLLTAPAAFSRACLAGPQGMVHLPFPLSGIWKRASGADAQGVILPFQALAFGLGLIALAGAVEAAAWRWAGLENLRDHAERKQLEGMQQAARHYYGHEMRFVKLDELSGLAPLDAALAESWHLVSYLAFAAIVSALMPKAALAHPRAVLHFFAYAVAVGLLIQAAARTAAAGLFVPLAGHSLEAALMVSTVVVLFFGYLPMIWLGAVLPIVTFPEAISVGRARVVVAVLGGLAIMGMVNVVLSQLMLGMGIVLV